MVAEVMFGILSKKPSADRRPLRRKNRWVLVDLSEVLFFRGEVHTGRGKAQALHISLIITAKFEL